MDNIHFSEPFEGFNFASSTDYNRTAPFYNYPRNHPWLQATYDDVFYDDDEDAVFNNGQTFCGNDHGFYDIGMPDSAELKRSWSGETLVPTSFTPESFATAEPNYHGDADLFTSSPFASGHDNTDPAEEVPVHSKQDDSQDDYMKPTRVMSTQSHIVTMSRPYVDKDRQGMARPYKWKRSPRCAKPGTLKSSADMKQEDPVTPTRASGTSARAGGTSTRARGASTRAGGTSTRARGVATQAGGSPTRAGGARSHFFDTQASTPTQGNGYLPVTPVTGSRTFTSPSTATFGRNTGFSQAPF